jgi:hypothetical protein
VYLDALTHLNNRTRVTNPDAEGVREAKDVVGVLCLSMLNLLPTNYRSYRPSRSAKRLSRA